MYERPPALCSPALEDAGGSSPAQLDPKGSGREAPGRVAFDAFPNESSFPGLPIATDPERMLALFRAHLKTVPGKTIDIAGCKPFRFRCRQGESGGRCVLQYTLRVADPQTGQEWDQWVTGLLYADPDEARRVAHELETGHSRTGRRRDRLTLEPVGYIPEIPMPVEVFPYDRKLVTLGAVMEGALDEVDTRLLARLGPGRWRVDEHNIEPTRYRTERGAALKYSIQARETETARREAVCCYLKVYRSQKGQEMWQLLRSISDRAEDGQPYSVVTPIVYLEKLRTLAVDEAPGHALNEILARETDPTDAVRLVAQAMAAFNQDDVPILHRESRPGRLEDLRKTSTLLQWACPSTRGAVQHIARAVEDGLEDAEPAPIHGDMKPDHAFVSGDRITFIDLDAAALGDPVRDPAQFVAYITGEVRMGSAPTARLRRASEIFVEEYFRHVPASWRSRFSIHYANALLEVATAIFRQQEPGWSSKVTQVVEKARHALSDPLV